MEYCMVSDDDNMFTQDALKTKKKHNQQYYIYNATHKGLAIWKSCKYSSWCIKSRVIKKEMLPIF